MLELTDGTGKGLFKCPHSKRKALLFVVEEPETKDMEKAEIFCAFAMLEPMVFPIFINDLESALSTLVGDARLRANGDMLRHSCHSEVPSQAAICFVLRCAFQGLAFACCLGCSFSSWLHFGQPSFSGNKLPFPTQAAEDCVRFVQSQ